MSTPATQVFTGTTQTNVVTVATPGPQGPTGPLGNPGPTGPFGGPTGPTGPPIPPSPPSFTNQVTATLPTGISDNYSPFSYVPGLTDCLILTATDATSTLAGISAIGVPNGFLLLLVNVSPTIPITILSQQSYIATNQFICAFNASIKIEPLDKTIITYITGFGWAASGPSISTQFYGTGIPFATVNPQFYNSTVILDGVATTFALTFPVAFADGQSVELLSNTAVSVAFSIVGSGDGSTINGIPSTTNAGNAFVWQYYAANTSWYASDPQSSVPNAIVSVTDATPGSTPIDNYAPTGLVGGSTNRLLLAASVDPTGTTINGLLATSYPDGFEIQIVETAGIGSLNFPHLASSSAAANRFSNQNAAIWVIPPLGSAKIKRTGTIWKFI